MSQGTTTVHQRSTPVNSTLAHDQRKRRDQHCLTAQSLDGSKRSGVQIPSAPPGTTPGRRWRITRLPMEHRAGQGADDAVHDLDVTRPPAGPADPDWAPAPWR